MREIEASDAPRWTNWSGSVRAAAQVIRPQTIEELGQIVGHAGSVRAVGAGHSFMPLCASDDVIISIADLPGRITVAPDRLSARVPAGWSLKRLTAALAELGLALANQGDVNPQTLAGAMATGTHGTGASLGSISTFARGFQLMGADGESRWCDATIAPELFEAQRLSLGLLGIVTEIDVAVVPAFYLVERISKMRLDEAREQFDQLATDHRHVEFFVFPYSDTVILKTLSLTNACDPPQSTTDLDEADFRRMLNLGVRMPMLIPLLQKLAMRGHFGSERCGPAHAIFPSDRSIRFEEMEYEMPRAVGFEALVEAMRWIRRRRLPVGFPFEFRIVAADDIWLSPMNTGPAASVSMHQYARQRWQSVFAEVEPIFQQHAGRPHWAKRHSLTREDVDRLYPMAEKFRQVRRDVDPSGKFLNPHLAGLFS